LATLMKHQIESHNLSDSNLGGDISLEGVDDTDVEISLIKLREEHETDMVKLKAAVLSNIDSDKARLEERLVRRRKNRQRNAKDAGITAETEDEFEKEQREEFALKMATITNQIETAAQQRELEIEAIRKAQVEAENQERSRLEQLELQRSENGREMALLENQFTEERTRQEEQIRKRLEKRKAKGDKKAAEEAAREKERLEIEFETKKRQLEEEQRQKAEQHRKELEDEAKKKAAEAEERHALAVMNLEKLKENQEKELQALKESQSKSEDAHNDRLQARLAKRRQRKNKGGDTRSGEPEDSNERAPAEMQKKIEEIRKRQKIQEDEAIRMIEEATKDAVASSAAYEGFKRRLKKEARETSNAVKDDAISEATPTNMHDATGRGNTYEEIIADLFRLEDDLVMTQEEVLVLEEFTRMAKKKLKSHR